MTDKNNNKKVRGKKNAGSGRTPHDEFVRKALSKLEDARVLIKTALPDQILKYLDLSVLRQRPDTIVKRRLHKGITDIQFECVTADNKPARVIVLIEHKSYVAKYVSIQIMQYMLAIWDKAISELKEGEQIPAIIPIIFYTGEKEWEAVTLRQMLTGTFYEEFIPDCKFIFCDVSKLDVKILSSQLPDSALLMLMHYMNVGNIKDIVQTFMEWVNQCKDEEVYAERLEDFLTYYSYISNDEELKEFINGINEGGGEMTERCKELFLGQRYLDLKQRYLELDQRSSNLDQRYLELDQRYLDIKAEGLVEGRAEGLVEGKAEGIDEANIHAMRMFVKKFQLTPIQALQALEISEQDWKRYLEAYSKKYPEVPISKQTVE